MIQLDYKSGVPLCDQIVNGVIRLKALGVLPRHTQLPSVRALAIKLSLNPNTVQKAYGILETKGVVYSIKGKGSFISDDDVADQAVMQKARDQFRDAINVARELGMSEDEMIALIQQTKKEANGND